MKTINSDIASGQFHHAYLLYGDEDYLKRQYARKLVKALVKDGDTMNYSRFEGDAADAGNVIDLAETLPFFAERRVIEIIDSGWFSSSNAQMAEYLAHVPESTIFIFVESKVDKRTKTYKAIRKNGYDTEMKLPDERQLMLWIGGRLKKEGKSMARDAWTEFYQRTGFAMDNMDQEFDKLLMYCADKDRITKDDVEAVCIRQMTDQVFDMINAIARQDTKAVLAYYHDMLAMKEPPIRILVLIERQFERMLAIRNMSSEHMPDREIARQLGVRDFVIGKDLRLARNFSTARMKRLLYEAADLEKRIKTGRMDGNMGVELLMLRYAKPSEKKSSQR